MIKIDIRKCEKCNTEYSLFVSFPYDADIIDIIREQSSVKYWVPERKEWELPIDALEKLMDSFSKYQVEINVDDIDALKEKNTDIPDGFKFKTAPYEHQIEGVKYGLAHEKWLLGDEQGLGKTKEVIDIAVAKKLQNGYKHCLIICGVNGLKWNWENEVTTHSNENSWILGQSIKNGKKVIGGNQDKYNDLLDLLHNVDESELADSYFIITNVESLRYKVDTGETVVKKGKVTKVYRYPISEIIDELCRQGIIEMIAFDEIHKCKDASSTQGAQLLEIKAKTMIAMSGTPLMNKPMDLYVPLKWLGYEGHSFYSFKNHYAIMGGYGGYEVVGYKNLDELQTKLDNIMLRRRKDDVLDLPDKIRINEYVEMTGKQEQIYKEVKADISANIDLVKSAPNPLAALIRMRQATGYTGILSSTVKESAKLDRMEELVEEARENGKQIVIFSNWTQMTDVICERLADYKVGVITGDTKDEMRQSLVNDFQDGKLEIMVGTIGAMGTGITLTAGTVEIFMDEPWNRANKEQAEDRCHRVGTKSNVTIYTLICKGTIDEKINKLVQEKGEMADRLVDGGKNAVNKDDLIDYLLS